jgi:hypothetical protein
LPNKTPFFEVTNEDIYNRLLVIERKINKVNIVYWIATTALTISIASILIKVL